MVRRCVGYNRYDTRRELDLLNQLWLLESTMTNLYLPQQKLLTKTRHGAKVIKTYDTATTPLDRIRRDHPTCSTQSTSQHSSAEANDLNPAQLRRDIDLIQRNLLELARRRGQTQKRAKRNHDYPSKTKITTRAKPDESTTHPKRAS